MKKQIEKFEEKLGIGREDIQKIATAINFEKDLTDEDVLKVLANFSWASEADSTGTWDFVVEDLLYQLEHLEVEA